MTALLAALIVVACLGVPSVGILSIVATNQEPADPPVEPAVPAPP